jgi:hypothetical protein
VLLLAMQRCQRTSQKIHAPGLHRAWGKACLPSSACDTCGLANWLLEDMINHADVVAEDSPESLKEARTKQTEAEHSHHTIKKEIADCWGTLNGPTLANMHLAQGHLNEQIEVEGEFTQTEREAAILHLAP